MAWKLKTVENLFDTLQIHTVAYFAHFHAFKTNFHIQNSLISARKSQRLHAHIVGMVINPSLSPQAPEFVCFFYFSTCLKNHKNGGKGREYGLFLLPFIFPILVTNTYIDSQVPVPPAILKLRLIHSCRPGYVQIQEGMPSIISIFQKYKYVLTEGDRALHRTKIA